MTSFPVIPLHSSPRTRAVVPVVLSHVYDAGYFRPVVAGEHHERIVAEYEVVERLHQLAENIIQFEDEVSAGSGVGLFDASNAVD